MSGLTKFVLTDDAKSPKNLIRVIEIDEKCFCEGVLANLDKNSRFAIPINLKNIPKDYFLKYFLSVPKFCYFKDLSLHGMGICRINQYSCFTRWYSSL